MDHLVFGVANLEKAVDMLEQQTGVRARFGGQHPGRGTHNALMSLGGRQYLEIIALDPAQPGVASRFAELNTLTRSQFIAWAVAVDSITDLAGKARAATIGIDGPFDGSRTQADGSLLTWKTLSVTGLQGLPFFIEWQKTTLHPSQSSPAGCQLKSFTIEHPKAPEMKRQFASLGVDAAVVPGAQLRLRARLQTPKGQVELG